ncbi:MAG: urea transporter permease subunit UrtB [Planctomycetota bacterium]
MIRTLLVLVACLYSIALSAVESSALKGLASEDRDERLATLAALAQAKDPRLVAFLQDYLQESAYVWDGRIVLAPTLSDAGAIPLDPLTRAPLGPLAAKSTFTELPFSRRREGSAAIEAITLLRLTDPDPVVRFNAVVKAGDAGGESNRRALALLVEMETQKKIRTNAIEGIAIIDLASPEAASRAAAAATLGDLASARALGPLRDLAAKDPDPGVKTAAAAAIRSAESWQSTVRATQTVFSGISAGSILIIMALGLAITFGLMGVINMAHGEMMMIGAYATLLVQMGFQHFLPESLLPWYFPCGLVAGFLLAGAVGWLIEIAIIRHLYGRPLETLLATVGIGQLLVWTVRNRFGESQSVTAPEWLTGAWEPATDLALPLNRLFVIALTAVSVVALWLLMNRTRLGLLLRATVQSRRTAGSLGVNTRRIDGFTFAVGSGLAGAAGCALTLISGLKPDMGQEYIIDSFLVVAAGGVGNLWGVVCTGLGLGMLNKFLEPWTQTVYAKVIVLAAVVVFLQWRPAGLFPPRGRLSDV